MQFLSKVPFFLSLAGLWAARAQVITSSSRTVQLGGNATYFVPGTPVASFNFAGNVHMLGRLPNDTVPLVPFSFITTSSKTFSSSDINNISSLWSTLDDVWSPLFLQGKCYRY